MGIISRIRARLTRGRIEEERAQGRHFVRDYTKLMEDLLQIHPPDEAMRLAVGGRYEEMGLIEKQVIEYAGFRQGMRLLDFGCGSGRLAWALKDTPVRYTGMDIMPELLAYAKSKVPDSFSFVLNQERSIPLPNESFDMVCAFSVLTHLLDVEGYTYLQEMRRILKPDGAIVFSFLEIDPHWGIFVTTARRVAEGHPGHLNTFLNRPAIERWSKELGMRLVEFVDHNAAPWQGAPLGQSLVILRKQEAAKRQG